MSIIQVTDYPEPPYQKSPSLDELRDWAKEYDVVGIEIVGDIENWLDNVDSIIAYTPSDILQTESLIKPFREAIIAWKWALQVKKDEERRATK